MNVPSPPDRGYDEHRARAVLHDLIGVSVTRIRVITLDELVTSSDGRIIEADLAVELQIVRGDHPGVALFHWAVNFGVEQICVWEQPLEAVWPQHADSPVYEVSQDWPGWPEGPLLAAEGFKLRPSEIGLNRIDLRFGRGGFRVQTAALSGDEIVIDSTTLLLIPLD